MFPCRRRRAVRFVALLGVACFGACSSEEPTYPVHGKVVYKDTKQPVPGGIAIWFESTKGPEHLRSGGDVNQDGTFSMATDEADSGSMAGEHRVRFAPHLPGASGADTLSQVMDRKHFEYDTSGIKVEVKADGPNELTIEVDPPTKKTVKPPANTNP